MYDDDDGGWGGGEIIIHDRGPIIVTAKTLYMDRGLIVLARVRLVCLPSARAHYRALVSPRTRTAYLAQGFRERARVYYISSAKFNVSPSAACGGIMYAKYAIAAAAAVTANTTFDNISIHRHNIAYPYIYMYIYVYVQNDYNIILCVRRIMCMRGPRLLLLQICPNTSRPNIVCSLLAI